MNTNAQPEALRLAAWLNEGCWHQIRLGDVEAAGRELRRLHAREQELQKQVHDLNWALGTEGYDKMHDPRDQADHEAACRGTERFVERMRIATERQAELERQAARYRWLRDNDDPSWRPYALRAGSGAATADARVDAARAGA